jgi:hypothetical protein
MIKIDVLTYASNYDYDIYERFVGSLINTGYNGNIYIIIKNHDLINIQLLQTKYKNVFCYIDTNIITTHLNNHRFFIMKDIINNFNFNDYLLITDFRDVLFQKNIETYNYDPMIDLYAFTENKKIKEDLNFNTPWLKILEKKIKQNFYNDISNNNIICCGTTIGKKDAIKFYLNMMCDYIIKYKIKLNLDQGIHNYIFYCNKLNNFKIKIVFDNILVNTVGFEIQNIDETVNILNKNNDISYIVHQYDRFTIELKEKLSNKYGYNFVK